MSEGSADSREVRGYSMPKSLHARLTREAKLRGWSRSMVIREALNFWFDAKGLSRPEEEAAS